MHQEEENILNVCVRLDYPLIIALNLSWINALVLTNWGATILKEREKKVLRPARKKA